MISTVLQYATFIWLSSFESVGVPVFLGSERLHGPASIPEDSRGAKAGGEES